jgi:hypothetical protein
MIAYFGRCYYLLPVVLIMPLKTVYIKILNNASILMLVPSNKKTLHLKNCGQLFYLYIKYYIQWGILYGAFIIVIYAG